MGFILASLTAYLYVPVCDKVSSKSIQMQISYSNFCRKYNNNMTSYKVYIWLPVMVITNEPLQLWVVNLTWRQIINMATYLELNFEFIPDNIHVQRIYINGHYEQKYTMELHNCASFSPYMCEHLKETMHHK
jgi:hypothetical protein